MAAIVTAVGIVASSVIGSINAKADWYIEDGKTMTLIGLAASGGFTGFNTSEGYGLCASTWRESPDDGHVFKSWQYISKIDASELEGADPHSMAYLGAVISINSGNGNYSFSNNNACWDFVKRMLQGQTVDWDAGTYSLPTGKTGNIYTGVGDRIAKSDKSEILRLYQDCLNHAGQSGWWDESTIIWGSGLADKQNLMTFKSVQPTGHGHLSKYSADTSISITSSYSLAGAEFAVYTDQACTQPTGVTFTTNASGDGGTVDLAPKTYWVKETKASPGYLLNTTPFQMVVSGGATAEVSVPETPKKGHLKIVKYDAETKKQVALPNFQFHLVGPTGKDYGNLTTDGTGEVQYNGDLPLGTYTVTEVKAAPPYILNNQSVQATINDDGDLATAAVYNTPVKGRITIHKTDDVKHTKLQGAKFDVYAVNAVVHPDGHTIYTAGQKVDTIVTDASGTGTSELLYIDKSLSSDFRVVETYTPAPFYIKDDQKEQTVTLAYKNETTPIVDISLDISNGVTTFPPAGKKVDEETHKPIAGATFNVTVMSDVTLPNGTVIYPKGTVMEQVTSKDGGSLVPTRKDYYLDADGTSHYAFVETGVPVPYIIIMQTSNINAKYVDYNTPLVDSQEVMIENRPQKQRITVTKIDNVTKTKIKGAKFDIIATGDITVNGDVKVKSGTTVDQLETGDDGTATSKDLYISRDGKGHYKLVETYVPEPFSFYQEESKHTWDVSANYSGPGPLAEADQVVKVNLTVENQLPYGQVVLDKIEDLTGGKVKGAVFDIVPVEDVKVPNGTTVSKDGITYSKGTVIETLTTDDNGHAESTKPLYIGKDANGKSIGHYKLVEKSVGQPYYFKDGEYTFDLEYENMHTEKLTHKAQIQAVNKVQYGNVKLHKNEDVSGGPVPHAVFNIVPAKDIVLPNGDLVYKKGKPVQTIVTDQNGDAHSDDTDEGKRLYLDKDGHGNYYLEEIDPGGAYAFPEKGTRYDFDLKYADDRTEKVEYGTVIPVTNRVPYADGVKITKQDEEDGSALDGAVFELRANEDITLTNGYVIYKKDQLIDTLTTKTDGTAESAKKLYNDDDDSDGDGVKDGAYYLIETKAPEGHVTVSTPYPVVVKYGGTGVPVIKIDAVNPTDKPNELDLNKSVLSKDGKTFDDEVVEGATFRLWKKEDELSVTPQDGKDAYALRIDGGDEGHDVVLTKPVGYAELALADGISGYTLAVRDAKGNMTKVGSEDAPAQVKTSGEDGLDLDVIVSDAAGKTMSGITGDRRITVHDGDRVVLDLDGVKKVETNDNENDAANGNGNTNDGTKTAAVTDAENDNANGDANASNENANANTDASASAISVKADFSHVKDSSLEPTVTSSAYIFDNLEPDTTYNVMVDKKVVYRLTTSDTSIEGTSDKADNDSGADADAGTDTTNREQPDNDSTDKDTGDDTQTDTGTTAGGKVYYGRLDTTASHYAYKRQPMLLTSDDKFIDKFTINGKDYPVETKTDADGKIIIKRIKTGEYGFGEVDVPFVGNKGKDDSDRTYLINTNVFRFTVDGTTGRLNDQEVLGTDFTDDWTQVDLSKNEITGGPEIPGAHLEIRDSDDKVVEEWTSTDTPHRVDRLTPGKYTLVEVMTPNNYDQATRVEFTVYDTGEVQKVEMHDQPIQINAKIDKRQEIADPVAENTEPNGDGKNKADVTESDEGKFRYSLDYKNDSTTWVDEFTVYDPLDSVAQGLVRLNGLTTAQAYQDFDGKMNVWFQTNKTPAEYDGDVSKANATKDDGHVNQWLVNPNDDIKSRDTDGDGRILSYTGWRLWKKDVSVTQATKLSVADLGLASDEYVTGIRLEYGRVEKGFTTRPDGWDRTDLKDEHDDMKPIEQIHKDTFTGTSRDAVLSRLALMRSFVASVADGIESKDVAGDDSSQNGNENVDANASDVANGNVSTIMGVADAQNGSESADENANDAGDENASAGASDAAASLVGEVSAALDRCEERVREALDAQDDVAVSKAMHDARNEVVRLIDAVMAESSTSKDTLTAMVAAVDAAYGSVSAGLDEATAKDAKAGIDEARHAAAANDAAVVRKNLGNAISDAIDGLVMSESYGRILKSEETANGNEANDADANDAAGDNKAVNDATTNAGGSASTAGNVSVNANAAGDKGHSGSDADTNEIHYSATILDMQVTDTYVPGTNLDNSAYVDAYRNGGGEGLEGHDNDKVTQTPRMADLASDLLAQTGDGTSLMAILSGTAAATIAGIALVRRKKA